MSPQIYVITIATDKNKHEAFQPVLDSYIQQNFHATLAYKYDTKAFVPRVEVCVCGCFCMDVWDVRGTFALTVYSITVSLFVDLALKLYVKSDCDDYAKRHTASYGCILTPVGSFPSGSDQTSRELDTFASRCVQTQGTGMNKH